MPWFPALVLTTKLFGFSLTPPVAPVIVLQTQEGVAVAAPAVEEPQPIVASDGQSTVMPEAVAEGTPPTLSEDEYFAQMQTRQRLARVHRIMGISTWASYTLTLTLGMIRYSDRYGFFAGRDDNPCARGTAVFGTEGCINDPWYHTVSGSITASLYATTFALELFMPDPDHASEGDSQAARRLRTHKILRWVHLGAMVAQVILGPIISRVGDRTNDYDLQQALATTHMAIGVVGYGALTAAGAIMLF